MECRASEPQRSGRHWLRAVTVRKGIGTRVSAALLAVVAAVASACLTWLAIAWARAARMHDEPGARRMHVEPTVRGAGIGFVAVIIAGWGAWGIALGWVAPLGRWAYGASAALLLVALVSWIDDRRGLPVLPRLATHFVAALLLLLAAWPTLAVELPWPLAFCMPLLAVPAINFWNFIDGINGMAAAQAILVSAALAVLALMAGDTPAAWFAALVAGAVLGFLPSNFPKARAFMGDVGSASLGFIVIALAVMPVQGAPAWAPGALLLAALVFLDTGLTLLWRMLRRPTAPVVHCAPRASVSVAYALRMGAHADHADLPGLQCWHRPCRPAARPAANGIHADRCHPHLPARRNRLAPGP
jgi:UDP-N-acetylmuramyl pentapeptide phosphotransferase/UDP-N-acetylglucosamine-1-phosphate transferase